MLEALVAGASGIAAGSIALIGFGLDSVVESLSGAVLLWRLRPERDTEAHERRALRLVGWSLVVLAAYVVWNAGRALLSRDVPDASLVGIGLATASAIVMPLLARAKRRVAKRLQSAALKADSRQTDFCTYLSWILLSGLLLNAWFGWWWADPVAALLMVPIILTEAFRAIRGGTCC